ncbi:hypothetical protein [Pontibacter liquoris]|uniref:hypothetical protein n=1 Tax=Pontibacter liquoris TaxID=2905677 RepID=UPI001FA7A9C1|nr:hypothetical protein [Pontibacter liquoris]
MKPEDIDKLFKDRLANTSPTPSADLWSRLQGRIEEEMPAAQPQEKKRSLMWLYSSIAASVMLLLAIGLVLYNGKSGKPEARIALQQQPAMIEQPARPEVQAPAASVLDPASIAAAPEAEKKEINLQPQATSSAPAASNSSKALAHVTKTPAKPSTEMKKATTPITSAPSPQLALAESKLKAQPAAATAPTEAPETTAVFASATDATAGAEPVEIIFKRAVNTQPALSEEPSGREKKTRLAKNIFKQVRNLSNGDPVELSSLGIRADKIALETRIGNQKFSKVINL